MKRLLFILIGISIFLSCPALADEVVLNNGKVIEGNIILVDKEGNIKIDVVLDNKVVGIKMEFKNKEVLDYKVDNKYQGLKREEPRKSCATETWVTF